MRRLLLALLLLLSLPHIDAARADPEDVPALPASDSCAEWSACPAAESPRFWGSAEYLLWWFRASHVSTPLVTAGSNSNPQTLSDVLFPNVVLGNQSLDAGAHSGGRFSIGYQMDEGSGLGIEGSYLFLARRQEVRDATTSGLSGAPNLAVPFFDVTGDAGNQGVPGPSVYILGGPLQSVGGVAAFYQLAVASQLQGAEANGTAPLAESNGLRLRGLLGMRWLHFGEDLTFSGGGIGLPTSFFPGPLTFFQDQFDNRNDFYGGQLGLRAAYEFGRFSLDGTAKIALGDTHEQADVSGAVTTPGGTLFLKTTGTSGQVFPGGVFTQPSNLGTHQRDVFSVVPEVKVDLAYAVTPRLKCFVGYTFLCISNVARPGDEIDPDLNITRTNLAAVSRATVGTQAGPIPFAVPQGAPPAAGPFAPTFRFHDSTFWAQGLDFGVAFSF
jgi:hypothetical protein